VASLLGFAVISLGGGWFQTRVAIAGAKPALVTGPGSFTLTYDWTMPALAVGLLLAAADGFYLAGDEPLYLLLGLTTLPAAGWFLLAWRFTRIHIDAEGGVVYAVLQPPRAFLWSEVATTRWGRLSSSLILYLPSGRSVRVNGQLNGFREFCVLLEERTATAVHTPGLNGARQARRRLAN
jgi:hypothetical protein